MKGFLNHKQVVILGVGVFFPLLSVGRFGSFLEFWGPVEGSSLNFGALLALKRKGSKRIVSQLPTPAFFFWAKWLSVGRECLMVYQIFFGTLIQFELQDCLKNRHFIVRWIFQRIRVADLQNDESLLFANVVDSHEYTDVCLFLRNRKNALYIYIA